ncbi:hypothetical protein GCM10028820_24940 [Tessaracoccus terricola]
MRRALRTTRALVAAALAAAALAALPQQGFADPTEQAHQLCDGAAQCRIDVASDTMREGAPTPVSVVGNPNVRVEVVAYLVVTDAEGAFAGLEQVASTGELFTSSSGIAQGELGIAAIETEHPGGLAVVGTAGMEDLDTSLVGTILPFGTRRPAVLGDGYATQKPAGAALELHHTGSIPGSWFTVEYLADDGLWQDVTAADGVASGPADQISSTTYFMPQGLKAEPYPFRLVNQTAGLVVSEWEAIPTADGVPQQRRQPVGVESLGAAPPPAAAEHPVGTVRTVSVVVAAAGLLVVAAGIPIANRSAKLRRGDA